MAGRMIHVSLQPPPIVEGDPQVEYFLENAGNLIDSWFLNMIFGTLCVMGPKINWSDYLHKDWLQRYQLKYSHFLKVIQKSGRRK